MRRPRDARYVIRRTCSRSFDDATGANQFRGEVIDGGRSIQYRVPALAAGSYAFKCDLHPGMKGVLVAK